MGASTPFEILQEIDQRCRSNLKGLPTGTKVVDDWVGIGFMLNGKKLVARMSDIAEILPPPETIRVPGVLGWVKGLANVRGTLLPILDMNVFLQCAKKKLGPESRVLIINKHNVVAGLLVEEVFGLRRFKPDMEKATEVTDMGLLEPYLNGVFSDEESQWNIFSIEKLVDHEHFLKVV
jgi:twitching motility protein PilI